MKKGKRRAAHAKHGTLRKSARRFYKILEKLDVAAQGIIQNGEPATMENIQELAFPYFNRPLDDMEQNILLNKIFQVYEKLGIEPKGFSEEEE